MQPKNFIKILTIIHSSLCFGLLLFAGFLYVQNRGFSTVIDSSDVLVYIVPTLAMAGYFGSKYVYQNLILKIAKNESLATKLGRYQVASLIKYALIEAPAFLSLFAYFASGNPMHLAIAVSLMVYLFFQRPTLHKIENEINLSNEELHLFKS